MEAFVRYSEAFKQQVVREFGEGKFRSIHDASVAYGIRGATTIRGWVCKYGQPALLRKVVHVQSLKEIDERTELKREVKKLKEAVSDLHLERKLESAFLQIACQKLGMDVEEFKKKHDTKR